MGNWVSTERLTARITLAEGLVMHGEVHLQSRVAWRDGPETPLELLNREEAFFPLTLPTGVVFVTRAQVAILAYDQDLANHDPERESAAQRLSLEVMMVGGLEFRGIANSELPPIRSRALDFLNCNEQFFALVTDTGTLCINRRHVRAIRPLS